MPLLPLLLPLLLLALLLTMPAPFRPTLLSPLPARGGPTLEGGLRPVELAMASGLDEAAKPPGVGLLELLLGRIPAAAVSNGRLPLTAEDGGAGERYAASGEAGDAFLTSGLCRALGDTGDKAGEADRTAGEATGTGGGEAPDSLTVVSLAALGDEAAVAAAVVLFEVPAKLGTRLLAVLLLPVSSAPILAVLLSTMSVDPVAAVLLEPASAAALSAVLLKPAESLEPAFAAPVLAVLLKLALGAPTPAVLLPAALAKADPPASV